MVASFDAPAYRVIASRYPTVSIYDRITDARDFAAVIELEALTNPRVREEAGDYRKIRPSDAVTGPGATPIMASFAYSQPSRFTDGTFGVYYAALDEDTAIAESLYHTQRFLRATHEPSIDLDKRMYVTRVRGSFDDVRRKRGALYASDDYSASQAYAAKLYTANRVDGIWYRSVRYRGGECVAVFRPRCISNARVHRYLHVRWNGEEIVALARSIPLELPK